MTRLSGSRYKFSFTELAIAPLSLLVLFAGASSASAAAVGLQRIAAGLNKPLFATFAPGDTERLFVVEQGGVIKILNLSTGSINPTPFLTIPDTDSSSNEEGLLGLAFHPNYATNGRFFVNVTVDDDGGTAATRTHIRKYEVSANPNIANPSATEVLAFNQPQSNHNGGWIGFSPNDGYLYIMSGDGGGGDDDDAGHTDETGNAQDITNNLLGKVLRIDVDGTNGAGGNYGNPATNPFVGVTGDDEIWSYGLRNPYRASFDRQTGDLWIGDVGQGTKEEIDFQPASSTGGENYGWRILEGTGYNPKFDGQPIPTPNVPPVYDYGRGTGDFQGFVVAGGYVYRGPDPELQGLYFFADSGSNNIWNFDPANPTGTVEKINSDIPPDVGTATAIASFAEDAVGNLYLIKLGSSIQNPPAGTGAIYKLVTDAVVPGDFNGDGKVDGADLAKWQASYELNDGADADGDGDSDGADFLIWQRNHGKTAQDPPGLLASSPLQIPEPATLALMAAGILGYWWTGRMKASVD